MKRSSLEQFVLEIKSTPGSAIEYAHRALEDAQKGDAKFHHFCMVSSAFTLSQAKSLETLRQKDPAAFAKLRLPGVALSVKDSILVNGLQSRAGSAILNGYMPLFDATVVSRAKAEGALVLGKTSQDEFGFGSYSVNTGKGFEVPKNPADVKRTTGGSSGGCAGFSARAKIAHVSFAESTGGSAACPASFCGVAAITPTYGRLSRNGLIDFGNSLDKISPMGRTIADAALLLEIAAGHDDADSTSSQEAVEPFFQAAQTPIEGRRIGVLRLPSEVKIDSGVQRLFSRAVKRLESAGAQIQEIELPLNFKYSIPVYYLIATAEVSTNLARYCGMRYGAALPLSGNYNEYFTKVRSAFLGEEAKRRLLLGTFCRMSGYRDAYYLRALKVRTRLLQEFAAAFSKVDVVVSPTMAQTAPTFAQIAKWTPLQHYLADLLVNPANVSGLPHASVNIGESDGLPVGLLCVGGHWKESSVISVAAAAEKPLGATSS